MVQGPENARGGQDDRRDRGDDGRKGNDIGQGKPGSFPSFADVAPNKVAKFILDQARELRARSTPVPFDDQHIQLLSEQLRELLIQDPASAVDLEVFSAVKFTQGNGKYCYLIVVKPEDDQHSYLYLDGGYTKATKGNVLIAALSTFEDPLTLDSIREFMDPNLFRKIQNDLVRDIGGRHAPDEVDLTLPVFDQPFSSPLTTRLFRIIEDECPELSWRSLGPVANYHKRHDGITVRVEFGEQEKQAVVVSFNYDVISALLTTEIDRAAEIEETALSGAKLPTSSGLASKLQSQLEDQVFQWLEGKFAKALGCEKEELGLSLSLSQPFPIDGSLALDLASRVECRELREEIKSLLRSTGEILAFVAEAKSETDGDWVTLLGNSTAKADFGELKMLLLVRPGGHLACVPLYSRGALGQHLLAVKKGQPDKIVAATVQQDLQMFIASSRPVDIRPDLRSSFAKLTVGSVALEGEITLPPGVEFPRVKVARDLLGCKDEQKLRVELVREGAPASQPLFNEVVTLRRLNIPGVSKGLGVLRADFSALKGK